VNARALGCGALAAAAFVAVGLIAVWRASAPAECPGTLPYQPAAYERVGTPMPSPALAGAGALERADSVSFGLAKWTVYVPPGMAPTATGEPLPPRIVLDCADGTFQAFQRGGP
jgi:hypothetical protein